LEEGPKGVPLKEVQGEDQRNKVQSSVQVPGGPGGPEGRGERDRSPSGPGLRGAPGHLGQLEAPLPPARGGGIRGQGGGEGLREEDRRTGTDAGAEGS